MGNIILTYYNMKVVYFDLETTGLRSNSDRIIEVSAVRVSDDNDNENLIFDELVNPMRKIPSIVVKLTKITDEMVKDKPLIKEVLTRFSQFLRTGDILIAHNGDNFDSKFLFNE